ncbi:unnamed protein product [Musa acuminata subsp. malaccensis]|uniref:(wild Malaysian banana) hypothetical protein n=1 Tax=Musa acuminata subsp. malaccensis TaxID=214687 RepID=A0A804J894_MUSAM|nr:unnamed protein product [Musa acuminata subsp. malaccensis]
MGAVPAVPAAPGADWTANQAGIVAADGWDAAAAPVAAGPSVIQAGSKLAS